MSTMSVQDSVTSLPTPSTAFQRFRRRHGWLLTVASILVIMLVWRAGQVPVFAGFAVRTITAGTLSLALVSIALGVVVLTGGFNFAVGSMVVFINCFSAWLMKDQGLGACLLIAVLAVALSVVLSALMGWVSVVSGVPDIVVTLAVSFILPGVALLILGGPGGGTSPDFVNLVVGGFANPWPSLCWLVAAIGLIWIPLARSRFGKALYALGSSKQAAFLAGVDVGRTRVKAYAVSGLFCGLAGV
ncbi:ABC transporter permease, partial [Streptomyces sp. NPDC001027]|uniref:ABC transporter permease n=1 Tax=Streptomyces sp. NPDC001027 TaxID=3154771 RepID=UPI00331BB90C